jgi:hypothetical protein
MTPATSAWTKLRRTRPPPQRRGDHHDPGAGESTAHVEVVTGLHPLKTTGAHSDGAYETENHFDGATANPGNRSFTDSGGNDVYILRPKKSAD